MGDSAGKELQKAEMKKASRRRHVGRLKRESTHGMKMPLGTYLARMQGEEGSKEKCEELEKQYLKRLHAEVGECKSSESECSDDFKVETMSQEELKQIITGWESGVKVEHVPSAKEGESHYYVNVLLMSPAQGEKTEPKKVVKLSTDSKVANTDKDTDSANVKIAQCVNKTLVNCGISEGKRRRMFMGKGVYSRAKSEKFRKSQRQTVKRRSSERAVFRAAVKIGKRVSKAKTDLMRLHYMGEHYNAGAHHGHERITLPVRKVLKRACPSNKFGGDRMGEKNFSEQRNSFWRKMNTAECMVMKKPPQRLRCSSDRGGEPCVKKPEAALEDSSHVREEGLSYYNAGDNINVGSPLSDVVLRGKRIPKLSSPEKRVDQGYSNDSERVFGIIAAIEKYVLYIAVTKYILFQAITKYILFQAITKYILFQAITKYILFQAITKFLLFQLYLQHIVATGKDDHGLLKNEIENYRTNDDEEELENCEDTSEQNLAHQGDYKKDHTPLAVQEESSGEHMDETCEQSDVGVLRLRGGANVWLTDDFEHQYSKADVIEYFNAQRNSSNPDLTQNLLRLLRAVQQHQISKLIDEQDDATIVRVLRRYNMHRIRKERRAQSLKMHFVKNPQLQQIILDDIEVATLLSPTPSECQSDGSNSDSHISSPVTPSITSPATPTSVTPSAISPATPQEVSPATPAEARNFADSLWEMSRSELIAFLGKENCDPSVAKKHTDLYRDKVGVIMIKKILKQIPLAEHRAAAVTQVMKKLKIKYVPHWTRRECNLITEFCRKEVRKEETMKKQVNILRELQLMVSKSSETRFTFPSPSNNNEFVSPPLPTTSKVNFPNPPKFELHSPPKKRQKKNSPVTESIPDVLPSGDEHVPAVQATQVRFKNPSSYCYLNALLNLLYSNPEVMRVIHADSTEQQLIEKADGSVDILYELRRLSEIPVTGDSYFGEGVRGEPGDVTYLKNLLGNEWAGDAQQDAHALFNELCSRLKCRATEDLFQIIFQTTRQCHGPGCEPVQHEEYCDGLMLQPSGHMPAVDLYQSACQPEEFECVCQVQDCDSRRSTRSRVMALSGTAMVMILERYRFEAEGRVRNDASIAVPLSMVINNKLWYLTGTVRNTSGSDTTESGHYTGLRRDCDTGQFYLNNDSSPFEELKADEAQQFIGKSYMIMYCAEVALPRRRPPPIQVGPAGDQLAAGISAGKEKQHEGSEQKISEQVDTPRLAHGCDNLQAGDSRKKQAGLRSKDVLVEKKTKSKAKKNKDMCRGNKDRLANDFNPTPEEQVEIRAFNDTRHLFLSEQHKKVQNNDFSLRGLPPNPFFAEILEMEKKLNSIEMPYCEHCDEVKFDVELTSKTKRCPQCQKEWYNYKTPGLVRKFSKENGMHCGEVPEELKNLTPVEQSAISMNFPIMKCYRLQPGGGTWLKGHCLAVNQDVEEFARRLPPRPADLPMVFIVGPGHRIPLTANANKILAALRWLIKHNPFYKNINIDMEALDSYPKNSTDFVEGLATIESNTAQQPRDPSTVYTSEEGDGPDIVHSAMPVQLPQTTVKDEIIKHVLGQSEMEVSKEKQSEYTKYVLFQAEDKERPKQVCDQPDEEIPKVEWPKKVGGPISERTRGYWSMAFPWLFPYGTPDLNDEFPGETPKLLEFLRHIMGHQSYRFAHDERMLLFGVNMYQREQLMSKAMVFAKYSCKDITVEKLKEQLAAGNLSTFKSLMYFTRSITGSRQFFKYEAKKALSFVNWVHIMSDMRETFNIFVTLSFADLHERALHRLLPGHEEYLDKIVVNSLEEIPAGCDQSRYILSSRDYRLRCDAVSKNGHIVCQYLNKKLWLFFEHILKPLGVVDYMVRIEFQYRSSEHFHMILRVLDGISVDTIHEAFKQSKFEVLRGKGQLDNLSAEEKVALFEGHTQTEACRRTVEEFSTFRLGQTAIHPECDPTQWPPPEGLNREKPRENCLRSQFTDVVTGQSQRVNFQEVDNVEQENCSEITTKSVSFSAEDRLRDPDSFDLPGITTKSVSFSAEDKIEEPDSFDLSLLDDNILVNGEVADRILHDSILLANRVQLHKCCRYCLKIVMALVALCKFHFPRDLKGFEAETMENLYKSVHNQMGDHPGAKFEQDELYPARNHPRLVVTIREFMMGWRANTSTEIIKSIPQLLNYVLKYMLKPTTGSQSFENTVKDITNATDNDAKASSIFTKVLMRQITEHDMSRTEAFRIVTGLPFVYYSRQFKNVNLLGVRMVVIDAEDEEMIGADRRATKDNKADLYWKREKDSNYKRLVERYEAGDIELDWHPREISLYNFVTYFQNNWTPSPHMSVPHISPQFRYPPDPWNPKLAEYRADYLRTQLLTFQPGALPQTLSELQLDQLEGAMKAFVETVHCPRLIREDYLASLEKKDEGEMEDEVRPLLEDPEPLDPGRIVQDPYMIGLGARLAKADLNNRNLIEESEEAAREDEYEILYTNLATDENEDWDRDRTRINKTTEELHDAVNWLQKTKAVADIPPAVWTESYEVDTLNAKQRDVYNVFAKYVMGDEPCSSGRLLDLSGGAGTGKSRLINTILYQAEKKFSDRNIVKVCAFTNSASKAFIGGKTVHRLFRIDVERGPAGTWHRNQEDLVGTRLQDLQDDFSSTRAIIIDEKSMIGCFMLYCIDRRLRQARPQYSHLMFGGLVVMLVGDLSQLPPVTDKPLFYDKDKPMTDKQRVGRELFDHFKENYFLTESMRQSGASNEQFRQELIRLANGNFCIEDWHRWKDRSLYNLPDEERHRFQNEGIKLCGRKKDMVSFNEAGLLRCDSPILVMEAEHNCAEAKKAPENKGEGLPKVLPVARGSAVVLTENLWPEANLINGSQGKVRYIVFEDGKKPSDGLPAFIVVSFPNYTGPPFIPGEPGTVPIFPRTVDWTNEKKKRLTRRMFPLLPADALTIHKSQGMTSDKPVIVNIGPIEFASGLTYTAVTRVRNLAGLAFDPMPSFNRLVSIFKKDAFKQKEKEMKKRFALSEVKEPDVIVDQPVVSDDVPEKIDDLTEGCVVKEKLMGVVDLSAAMSPTSLENEPILIDDDAPDDSTTAAMSGEVCSFPPTGRINHVYMADYERLDRTNMLNDTLVKFGLDLMELMVLPRDLHNRLYIFDSLGFGNFYRPLSAAVFNSPLSESSARDAHARVAHLTRRRSIDLFAKDIVIWPIERSTHWYMVVGVNLGKDSASLFTVNSAGSYGEGSILEHIKSYLAIEWEKKRGNSSPPNFCTQKVFPPQQQGGIDCGVFLISFVESIVRNFHDFANGLVQFEPVDPTRLRQYLARSIRRLSQEQGFQISQWPRLDL